MVEVITKDVFLSAIKILVDEGDMKSVTRARRVSKEWQTVIDSAPFWENMLAEIGGRMWQIEHKKPAWEVIREQFQPPAKFVMQCYGYIIRHIAGNPHFVDRLWGIITDNTSLALRRRDRGYGFHGGFQASDFAVAAAYGRTEIIDAMKDTPALQNYEFHHWDLFELGNTQKFEHWPLKNMMVLSNDPFLNALLFCQTETTRMLLKMDAVKAGANLLNSYHGIQYICFAFANQYPEESKQMISMLLEDLINDPHELYEGETVNLESLLFYACRAKTSILKKIVEAIPKLPGWSDKEKHLYFKNKEYLVIIITKQTLDNLQLLLKKVNLDNLQLYKVLLDLLDLLPLDFLPEESNDDLQDRMVMLIKHLHLGFNRAATMASATSEANKIHIELAVQMHDIINTKYDLYSLMINYDKRVQAFASYKKLIQYIWDNRTRHLPNYEDSSSKEVDPDHDNNEGPAPKGGEQWKKN